MIAVLLSGCHGGMVQWFSRKKPYNGYRVSGFSWQLRAAAFANVVLAVTADIVEKATVTMVWRKQWCLLQGFNPAAEGMNNLLSFKGLEALD
ncbi:hypothetical protein MTR_6g068890 [Medicago truncatula]|uniref:Uncharacterized protein n=1 Tax=Medicago truncatula TaxID=3880 RepID=G7KPC2_MEDTR|nr:hypothetical protein MTR_6g068890 [Medicago truncatula]